MPRGQREARAHEERRANAAVMRDKAEEIFEAIAGLEQQMGAQFLATTRAVAAREDLGEDGLPTFDRIRALCAVYFPDLLGVLDRLEAPMQERMQRAMGMIRVAAENKSAAVRENDLRLLTFEVTVEQWKNVGIASRKLRESLIEAVRPYRPGGVQG